jgi:hypothetical protein
MRPPQPLYNREDARRIARTVIDTRAEQGESVNISTRRMAKLPANLIAGYFSRPARFRAVQLAEVRNDCVVFTRRSS